MKDYRKEDIADFCLLGFIGAMICLLTFVLFCWARGDDPMIAALLLVGWH